MRTYGATLRSIVPKVTSELGPPVLPRVSEPQFFAFFGSALLLGPKSASPVSSQPGVRWSYVKLVKAAIACWRVALGQRAVLGDQWSPRMGVFWSGMKRPCVHASVEKLPLLLEDAHGLRRRAEVSCNRIRQAAECSDLPSGGSDLGRLLAHAVALRRAASACVAVFAMRRASEVSGLKVSDVSVVGSRGVVELKVRCQEMTNSAWAGGPIWLRFLLGEALALRS